MTHCKKKKEKHAGVETRVGDVFTFTIKHRLYFKLFVSSIVSQVSVVLM